MSPSRGVRWSAPFVLLSSLVAVTTFGVGPASSSALFDQPGPFLENPSEPLARSPRLVGMGRIGYVLEDAHHRITMWDLGANPIGVIDADSGSTLEFGPVTGAASSVTDIYGVSPVRERQTLGVRDVRAYYEGWKRSENTTYGA